MLQDNFGRTIRYLRLSVTDRCDMQCSYCKPEKFKDYSEPKAWLSFDEMKRLVQAFVDLGVEHVRITGGEPLLRKNLPDLVSSLSSINGLADLSLSTNCSRMEPMAEALYKAGIKRLNVSLDTLDPDLFHQLTRGDLEQVLNGIETARMTGFSPIRINTVVMKGINDDEIEAMLNYCGERNFTLRLIETMPMGIGGKDTLGRYMSLQKIKKRLDCNYKLIPVILPGGGPARYYQVQDSNTKIGFITPLSQHFCDTCNRLRITADGILHLCLGQENQVPLGDALRAGISQTELKQQLLQSIKLKPEKHEFCEKPGIIMRSMTRTGG